MFYFWIRTCYTVYNGIAVDNLKIALDEKGRKSETAAKKYGHKLSTNQAVAHKETVRDGGESLNLQFCGSSVLWPE